MTLVELIAVLTSMAERHGEYTSLIIRQTNGVLAVVEAEGLDVGRPCLDLYEP